MSAKVRVRNPGTGRVFPCCWDDCWRPGDARVKAEVTEGVFAEADMVPELLVGTPKVLTYIFCSDRHKAYWVNSHRDMGNLPPGVR